MEMKSEDGSDEVSKGIDKKKGIDEKKPMGKRKIEETNGENCDLFCCTKCGSNPCKWVSVGKKLLPKVHEFIEENGGRASLTNAQIRFFYYRGVTSSLHGYLGARNRRRLPGCIVHGVQTLSSNKDNMGHVSYVEMYVIGRSEFVDHCLYVSNQSEYSVCFQY